MHTWRSSIHRPLHRPHTCAMTNRTTANAKTPKWYMSVCLYKIRASCIHRRPKHDKQICGHIVELPPETTYECNVRCACLQRGPLTMSLHEPSWRRHGPRLSPSSASISTLGLLNTSQTPKVLYLTHSSKILLNKI